MRVIAEQFAAQKHRRRPLAIGVLSLIAIAMGIAWIFGVAFLPEYRPWVHVPLVVALLAVATLIVRPLAREYSAALEPETSGPSHTCAYSVACSSRVSPVLRNHSRRR